MFAEESKCKAPHIVIQLSSNQYQSMKENFVHVTDATLGTCDGNQVQWYKKFTYGANVISRKKKNGGMPRNGALKDIKISEMPGRCFDITCNKSVFTNDTNVYIIDSQCSNVDSKNEVTTGIILLLYCVDDHQCHVTGWEWNQMVFKAIKTSKNNVITKKNNHNGSSGFYYSYGNRGNFGMIDGSSVGQYSHKKFKNDNKTTTAHVIDSLVDKISSHELGAGIDSLSHRIPNINDLISPILDAAYHRQSHKGTVNLKRVEAAKHGVWQRSVCVNAVTAKFHVEDDCTNTVIVVPK